MGVALHLQLTPGPCPGDHSSPSEEGRPLRGAGVLFSSERMLHITWHHTAMDHVYYAERGLKPGAGHAVRLGVAERTDLDELVCTQVEQGFFSAEGCSLWTWAALGISGSQQVPEEGPSVWQSWTNGLSSRLPPSHNISSWKEP